MVFDATTGGMEKDPKVQRTVLLDPDTVQVVHARASFNKRSFNGELAFLLERALALESEEMGRMLQLIAAVQREQEG